MLNSFFCNEDEMPTVKPLDTIIRMLIKTLATERAFGRHRWTQWLKAFRVLQDAMYITTTLKLPQYDIRTIQNSNHKPTTLQKLFCAANVLELAIELYGDPVIRAEKAVCECRRPNRGGHPSGTPCSITHQNPVSIDEFVQADSALRNLSEADREIAAEQLRENPYVCICLEIFPTERKLQHHISKTDPGDEPGHKRPFPIYC